MADNSNVMELNKSRLHKNSKEIIRDFSLNDVSKIRKNLLTLILDYYAVAPDEMANHEVRQDITVMYWSLDSLLENIEKYKEEIRYEIERREG